MRVTIVWILVALTLALTAWFWVKPIVFPALSVKVLIPLHKTQKWDWKAPVPPPPPIKGEKKAAPPTKHDKGLKLYEAPIPTLPPEVPSPLPPTKYEKFKSEAADWGGIIGKFSPLITAIVAVIVRRRGKKREKE
jgi:hypothetical protein